MDLAEKGWRLGLLVCAMVEEAEGGLYEDEGGEGDPEALVGGIKFGVSAVLDGDVDAEGEAGDDADDGAALPDQVEPECEAERCSDKDSANLE